MKIVVNRCFGGFGLSDDAILFYGKLAGINLIEDQDPDYPWLSFWKTSDNVNFFDFDIVRTDSNLVQVVEQLGEKSFGKYAKLEVVEIPDDIEWSIREYDGYETIEEAHRSW